VYDQLTSRATIDARRQRDPVPMTTARAILRRIRWIHFDHRSPSFFRFEDHDHYELPPSRVTDALGQVMVLDHTPDVQIFDFDALVLRDQLSRLFEMKIASLSFDLQVLLLKQANRFLSPFASFDSA
jgi:hypothetical protein